MPHTCAAKSKVGMMTMMLLTSFAFGFVFERCFVTECANSYYTFAPIS